MNENECKIKEAAAKLEEAVAEFLLEEEKRANRSIEEKAKEVGELLDARLAWLRCEKVSELDSDWHVVDFPDRKIPWQMLTMWRDVGNVNGGYAISFNTTIYLNKNYERILSAEERVLKES